MSVEAGLFGDIEPVEPPRTTATGRRRTRQDALIARGFHPISGLRLRGGDETCGTCVHRVMRNGGARDWPKCDLSNQTHGPGTDCLARFPACTRWEPADA